jgi:hypothetical protein
MTTRTDHHHTQPPIPPSVEADLCASESVDLKDPQAVSRAIDLHQRGIAVFAVPFGSVGEGSLTWLDPRARQAAPSARRP